jgi:hypothetical protein
LIAGSVTSSNESPPTIALRVRLASSRDIRTKDSMFDDGPGVYG